MQSIEATCVKLEAITSDRGRCSSQSIVAPSELREASVGEVFQAGHTGAVRHLHHVVGLVGLQEQRAGAVLGDLLFEQGVAVLAPVQTRI